MNPSTQLVVWLGSLAAAAAIALLAWLVIRLVEPVLVSYRKDFETRADLAVRDLFLATPPAALFKLNLLLIGLAGTVTWLGFASPALACAVMVATAFAPWALLRLLKRRRLDKIEQQLPSMLQAVAGNMKAGVALAESLKQVQAEFLPPLAQEIQKVLQEQQVGKSLDEALENLARRVPLVSMNLATSAIRIAANVGGPLSETLERLAATLRTKRALEAKIRALTSQGKLQAWVVGALPIGLIFVLSLFEPEDMGRMFNTTGGYATLATIVALEVLGVSLIRKIASIDV